VTVETDPELSQWAWYAGAYQQYHSMLFPLAALHQTPDLPEADRIMAMADHVFGPSPTTSPRERSQTILRAIKENMASFLATIDPGPFPDAQRKRSLVNDKLSAEEASDGSLSISSSIDNIFAQPYIHPHPSPYQHLYRYSTDWPELLMHHRHSAPDMDDCLPSTHGIPVPVSAAGLVSVTTMEEHNPIFYPTTNGSVNGNGNLSNSYFGLSPSTVPLDGIAASDTWWKWPPELDQDDLFRELSIF